MLRLIILFFSILLFENSSFSKDDYFLTLRNEKVNLRQGPSFEYPIKIFYKKKNLPVLIKDKSANFRKIIDHENNSGWIHISQLSKKRAAIIISKSAIVFRKPTLFSKPQVILKKGKLCIINKCNKEWCKIKVNKYIGWIQKEKLWGRI